jgi:hypothetical protein
MAGPVMACSLFRASFVMTTTATVASFEFFVQLKEEFRYR